MSISHDTPLFVNANSNLVININCGRCHAVASRRGGYVASFAEREYFLCCECLGYLEQQVDLDYMRAADLLQRGFA